MTDATIVVVVAAIPTTIASLTAAIIALAALRRSVANGVATAQATVVLAETKQAVVDTARKLDAVDATSTETKHLVGETGRKIDAVDAKAVAIGSNTDGQLSKLTGELAVAHERIAGFEKLMIAALEQKRDIAIVNAALLERADAAPAVGASTPFGRRAGDQPA